jgi:DDE superfamily endonuclease
MLQPTVRRTWGPRGRTPISHAWDRHDRLSVLSALTVSPGARGAAAAGRAAVRRLAVEHRHHRRAGHAPRPAPPAPPRLPPGAGPLVGAPIGGAATAGARGDGRIEVEWLPGYAPELNPVEQVWQRAKYTDLANFVPEQAEHLRLELEDSLVKTRGQQAILRSFFAYAKLKL